MRSPHLKEGYASLSSRQDTYISTQVISNSFAQQICSFTLISLFFQSFIYGSMDSWSVTQLVFSHIVTALAISSFRRRLRAFNMLPLLCILSTCLFSGDTRHFNLILCIAFPSPRINHPLKEPWCPLLGSCILKWYLKPFEHLKL